MNSLDAALTHWRGQQIIIAQESKSYRLSFCDSGKTELFFCSPKIAGLKCTSQSYTCIIIINGDKKWQQIFFLTNFFPQAQHFFISINFQNSFRWACQNIVKNYIWSYLLNRSCFQAQTPYPYMSLLALKDMIITLKGKIKDNKLTISKLFFNR